LQTFNDLCSYLDRVNPACRIMLHSCGSVRRFIPDLIEAGVDVDFQVVWRALGPLDSIVQSFGAMLS